MVTKVLSLLSVAGLVVLSGCHDKCCSDGNSYHSDNDHNRMSYVSDNGDMRSNVSNSEMRSNVSPDNMNQPVRTNYYDNSANEYAEGTVSTVAPDGRITMRGFESPYANSYASYHREYYGYPEAQREGRSREMREKYQGKLNYSENKDKERDFNFNVSTPEKFTIQDESSRYGRSTDSWNYSTPRTYRYNDIKAGDRVVVGYDSAKPGTMRSMYRVEANKK